MRIIKFVVLFLILMICFIDVSFAQNDVHLEESEEYYLINDQPPIILGDLKHALHNVKKNLDKKTIAYLKVHALKIKLRISAQGKVEVFAENEKSLGLCPILEIELNKLVWMPSRQTGMNVGFQQVVLLYMVAGDLNLQILDKEETVSPGKVSGGDATTLVSIYNAHGAMNKCTVTDAVTGRPLSKAMLRINAEVFVYSSDPNGTIDFYCDAGDEISIYYLGYQSVSFIAQQKPELYNVNLDPVIYQHKELDLRKFSPNRMPVKADCPENDYISPKGGIVIFSLDLVSENAVFNGEPGCMRNYLATNFLFPEEEWKKEAEQVVEVFFTVSEDGKVESVVVSPQVGDELNSHLVLLFETMPTWRPAKQLRGDISQNFVLPLRIGPNRYWNKYYRK